MKKTVLALSLLSAALLPGCIGPNNAFRSVSAWNSRITDSKWWNEVIHIGLWVIPVYQAALLADIVIFNSVEFWGGENPISDPEPVRRVAELEG